MNYRCFLDQIQLLFCDRIQVFPFQYMHVTILYVSVDCYYI